MRKIITQDTNVVRIILMTSSMPIVTLSILYIWKIIKEMIKHDVLKIISIINANGPVTSLLNNKLAKNPTSAIKVFQVIFIRLLFNIKAFTLSSKFKN
ncbi:MAG: hypothetical protein Q8N88_01140 [Nanoarchaeota archaeon]|nr:hypothetical protein [Nanoarchaeota archaeon]